MEKYYIDPDISKAETLPSSFYLSEAVFEAMKEKIFSKSWQWMGDVESLFSAGCNTQPLVFLPEFMDEHILLIKSGTDDISCLSNVCTHRANLVIQEPSSLKQLVCGYHGRQFKLDGTFKYMPEFKLAKDFPRPCDDLKRLSSLKWMKQVFVGIDPAIDIRLILEPMVERISFLDLDKMYLDKSTCKTYELNAHWALYCDNYLEGFHIPFVHKELNEVLDFGKYETLLFDRMNLQIGYASDGEDSFDFPQDHIDFNEKIAAYYFWIFPNMMFNFYPWGLSVNIVIPISTVKTKIHFYSYVINEARLEKGAGGALDKVEHEDELVVEAVQKGLRSRYYKRGRFSPNMEKGVHHFHSLLADFLNASML